MSAALHDLYLSQGETHDPAARYWRWLVDTLPVDLTGYTATLEIYKSQSSTAPLATWSTANGKLVITPLDGRIALNLAPADTNVLYESSLLRAEDVPNTLILGSYNLDLTSSTATVKRLMTGRALLAPKILAVVA